jgi:hypothetical protein
MYVCVYVCTYMCIYVCIKKSNTQSYIYLTTSTSTRTAPAHRVILHRAVHRVPTALPAQTSALIPPLPPQKNPTQRKRTSTPLCAQVHIDTSNHTYYHTYPYILIYTHTYLYPYILILIHTHTYPYLPTHAVTMKDFRAAMKKLKASVDDNGRELQKVGVCVCVCMCVCVYM